MVEGPGCTLNGEKIRARVQKGQKVLEIRGSEAASSRNDSGGATFQCLVGSEYTGLETLGKELFMYFGARALRLHFGMNGSMRVNPIERHDARGNLPTLFIRLTKHAVCFFNSTAELRLSEDCEEKVRIMAGLDVCSPSFSHPRAVESVSRETGRMLCDVLLDQAVLPGVGNIIKNEALINSSLHPAVKVDQLRSGQIHHLVKMVRGFSQLFYQCKRRGKPLHHHCKVYKRSICGQCKGSVTVCRLGDESRMTYFCHHCQPLGPGEVDISFNSHMFTQMSKRSNQKYFHSKLLTQNTMLGWTDQRDTNVRGDTATKEEEEWTCDLCTMINLPISKSCEACLTPRPETPGVSGGESSFPSALIRYPYNSFSCPQQEVRLHRRPAFGNATLVLTDLSQKPAAVASAAGSQPRLPLVVGGGASTQPRTLREAGMQPMTTLLSRRTSPGSPSQPSKRRKIETGAFPKGAVPNSIQPSRNGFQDHTTPVPKTPCCTSHGRPSCLRVVSKAGENQGRHFYTCSLPRGTQCNFFEWADLHFPMCHHGNRTLMRTVLKLGPSNGRKFYVCPLKRDKQCDFFQWAENSSNKGTPLGSPTNQMLTSKT